MEFEGSELRQSEVLNRLVKTIRVGGQVARAAVCFDLTADFQYSSKLSVFKGVCFKPPIT